MKKLLTVLAIACMFSSCEKDDGIFDHPFVYVTDNETYSKKFETINSLTNKEISYAIILSSKTLDEPLVVEYDLEVGDGLTEGVDFELLSPKKITFPIGLYEYAIQIQWKPRLVDETKDNSVTIALKKNSKNFTMGFPGPSEYNKNYKITKENL